MVALVQCCLRCGDGAVELSLIRERGGTVADKGRACPSVEGGGAVKYAWWRWHPARDKDVDGAAAPVAAVKVHMCANDGR
jgi:hypothetical protein